MYARVTVLEIDTVRIGVDEAVEMYRSAVLPDVRRQEGFRGIYVLATEDGKGVMISLWDREEQAASSLDQGFYADVIARYLTLFRAPPGRETYEVAFSELVTPERAPAPSGA